MNRKLFLVMIISLSFILAEGAKGQQQQFLLRAKAEAITDHKFASASDEELIQAAQQALRSAFIENKGQMANEEVAFYGNLVNGKIGLGESKVLLWSEGWDSVVTLHFEGAQPAKPIAVDELKTKSNYFLGERGTYANVRSFGAIVYNDLWQGIDLYYKATPEGVKYEFRVAPGANPDKIKICCEGQEQLSIGKDSLTILKADRRFVDEGLLVFQEQGEINASFVAKGSNSFGFRISDYDKRKVLVIDPLLYSTFVGGRGDDFGWSLVLDSTGNAYVTGWTWSENFPTTSSAYDKSHNGYFDCFVFKLSSDGSSLLYSTYIGGLGNDIGYSIAIDNSGNAYVTGGTGSRGFPTTANAYNRTYGGNGDCFVFKLAPDGSSLLYSTFVGRSSYDLGWSLALDSAGNVYVTGETASSDFPTTENAYNESYSGGGDWGDCFVFKLSADGSSLLYSTFIGGSNDDRGFSLALDSEESLYVTGWTSSSNFPTITNAFDESYNGGGDCFVFKLSADCSSLLSSTFVGGSDFDCGWSLALDSEGNAYVTGGTSSSDFSTITNAFDESYNGGGGDWGDCFVFKLSADGSSLLYSTFVGGSSDDIGRSVVLDDSGDAHVTGRTNSSDFPTTENAYDESHNGGGDWGDCFVFKLAMNGSTLLYSTFIGGSDNEYGLSLALDSAGNVYVTGETTSSDFPTKNAYDDSYNGGRYLYGDCFVFKLSLEDISSGAIGISTTIKISITVTSLTTISTIAIISRRRKKRN